MTAFRSHTEDFPFPLTRTIALQVMSGTLDPFRGDRTHGVDLAAPRHKPLLARALREKMMADVAAGFTAGPYDQPPYPNARVCNLFSVPKHKYVESDAIRIVHHLSEAASPRQAPRTRGRQGIAPGSINSLCSNPHWMTAYFSPRILCDVLAHHGHGVTMAWRDVPKAFKRNPSAMELLFLHVSQLRTEDDALEYYVELCNTFGWVPSEWGWQAVTALIAWWLERADIDNVFNYVDNYWQIQPPGTDAAAAEARFDSALSEMGLVMHEQGSGTRCPSAMGWELNLDLHDHPSGWKMVMICPLEKFTFYREQFQVWCKQERLSVDELATIAGTMMWLATGLPAGAAYVGPLVAARTRAEHTEAVNPLVRVRPSLVRAPEREGLTFFARLLRDWDRIAPIVGQFGPTAGAECEGWVDAATTRGHGCGGIFWQKSARKLLALSHVWTEGERQLAMCDKRESTGVLEAIAIARWMTVFGARCSASRTLLRTDNEACMLAFQRAFSDSQPMLHALRTTRLIAGRYHIALRIVQVKGVVFNRIADLLSHRCFAEARSLALEVFGAELVLL